MAWYIDSVAIISPSLNFAIIVVSSNSCAIFLTFRLIANVSYILILSSQSPSPQNKFNWIRPRRVFRCITNIERFNVCPFSILLRINKISETLFDSLWILCVILQPGPDQIQRLGPVWTFQWINTWNNGLKPLLVWFPLLIVSFS